MERPSPASAKSRSNQARPPERLFDVWNELARQIHASELVVLFLDFDGTLVRIQPDPKAVSLENHTRSILRELSAHPKVVLCVISGRKLDDLQKRIHVDGAIYFGLHGFERSNRKPGAVPQAAKLKTEVHRLAQDLQHLSGIRIEDKKACFAIHYRSAPQSSVEEARSKVEEAMSRLGDDFRLMSGKKIWEIYPREIGTKGAAALDLLTETPGRKLVIYVGDDTTDETAFEALEGAVTVRVGCSESTHAKYFLNDPEEVLQFLKRLQTAIS